MISPQLQIDVPTAEVEISNPWIISILHHIQQLRKESYQLHCIQTQSDDVDQKMLIDGYLKKNDKLQSIASELLERTQSKEDATSVKQLQQEFDLFQTMHTNVAKTYFAFIAAQFQPRVIQLRVNQRVA